MTDLATRGCRGRRLVATVAAVAVTVAACAGADSTAELDPVETSAVGMTTDAEAAAGALTPFGELDEVAVDADVRIRLVDALEAADVVVVDEPTDGAQRYEVLSSQVDAMVIEVDLGGGFVGTELDAAAPGDGSVPASALLAAYVVAGDTPGAALAREWVDVESVSNPAALVFPRAVLTLFIAESISTALDELGIDPAGVSSEYLDPDAEGIAGAGGMSGLVSAPCSTVANWVESALSWVFDKLRITTSGGGFVGLLATIWNTAVGFAEQAVRDAIENVTAPVINSVRNVLGVLATVAQVVELFNQWDMAITSDVAKVRYGVREPGETGTFTAEPFGLPKLPPALEDCRRTFDVVDPTDVAGFPASWDIRGIPDYAEEVRSDDALTEDRNAEFDFRANTESDDRGEEETWSLSPSITVERDDIARFERQALDLALSWIPASPVTPFARDVIRTLTAPVLEEIREMNDAKGIGKSVLVVRHLPCVQSDPVLYDGRWTGPITFDYSGLFPGGNATYAGSGTIDMTVAGGQVVDGVMAFDLDLTGGEARSGSTTVRYDSLVAAGEGTVGGSAAAPVITGSVDVRGQVTATDPAFGEIQVPPFSVTGPPNPVTMTLSDVTCDIATGDFIPGINAAIDQAGGGGGVTASGTAVWDGRWLGPGDD